MPDWPILPHKSKLLDLACERYPISSVVDVGGCWGVNGGYCFRVVDQRKVKQAYIVDGILTKETIDRNASRNVVLLQGDIGGHEILSLLPAVDLAIIFDILLHQVNPNWDEFLNSYSKKANHIVIYNQDWVNAETIRFVDYDCDWYIENVVNNGKDDVIQWYNRHYETCGELKRQWRDVHYFWQWGITASDIIAHMVKIGFQLDYFWNYGYFDFAKPKIENHGYLFSRRGLSNKTKMYADMVLTSLPA